MSADVTSPGGAAPERAGGEAGAEYAEYRGADAHGTARIGVLNIADVPAWVEAKFRAGWRSLVVAKSGVEVGRIAVMDGKRIWTAQR